MKDRIYFEFGLKDGISLPEFKQHLLQVLAEKGLQEQISADSFDVKPAFGLIKVECTQTVADIIAERTEVIPGSVVALLG